MPHAGHVLEVGNSLDVLQPFAVQLRDMPPRRYCLVHLPEVQQAYRRAYLVHLAVDSRGHYRRLVREAEVLEVVDTLLGLLVMHYQRAALHGVVDLCGVEAKRGHVAGVEYGFSIHFDAESVCRVVYHLEPVLVGNLLYAFHVARFAVAVHRHDGRGLGGDGRLNLIGVHTAVRRVDVHEHRLYAVPPDRMGRSHETERRGDHLPGNPERLQRGDERQGAVGEEADIWDLEVFAEGLLKFSVVVPVVGDPLARPDVPEVSVELLKVRQKRRRHRYLFVFHLT